MRTKLLYLILLIVSFISGYSVAFRTQEEKIYKVNSEWLEMYNNKYFHSENSTNILVPETTNTVI